MPLVSMRQLLDHAAENEYGLAAFNVGYMEQIKAIMEAAKETESPVIIQAGKGARDYINDCILRHLMVAVSEVYPHIPVALHQDHGNAPATCKSALDEGFTSVMMDGSLLDDYKTPSDFEYNVRVTREVVDDAHPRGCTVEGELGCLGSLESGKAAKEDGHGAEGKLQTKQLLTDPDEAVEFVERTNVDALAVAIGTSHGAYKFTREPDGEILAMDRLQEIHKKLPNTHLVMHGCSSVPQELQDLINEYGGEIKQTWGVPVEEIQRGIRNGVRKVNVDTDNRMAIIGEVRKALALDLGVLEPRRFLTPGHAAMKEVCMARMISFGQAGNATKIKPVPLGEVAKMYF